MGGSVIRDVLGTEQGDSIVEMKFVGKICWVMMMVEEVVTRSVSVKMLILACAGPQDSAEILGEIEVLSSVATLEDAVLNVLNGPEVVFGTEGFRDSVLKGVDVMFSPGEIVADMVEEVEVVSNVELTATRIIKRRVENL
jgi:hypothetical protein